VQLIATEMAHRPDIVMKRKESNPEIKVLPRVGIWEANVAWTERWTCRSHPVFMAPGLPSTKKHTERGRQEVNRCRCGRGLRCEVMRFGTEAEEQRQKS
jgi:hypothetical protein